MVWGIPLKFKALVTQLVEKFPTLHDTLHKSMPLNPNPGQPNQYHTIILYLYKRYCNIALPNDIFRWD
jgi:hypothetical protein